uniref:Carnosine synthase 1-like n=1 Tax=Salmo trutta TaxID=8032 RepID=A0A673W1Q8_SALTR
RSSSSLLVHKAVTFDLGGRTFLSNFNPPRRVTYFLSSDPWAKEEMTRETDCPSGGSGALGQFWGNVLTTRVLLQKAKIHCPPTLALLLPPGQMRLEEGRTGGVEVVHLEMGAEEGMNSVRNKVDTFLESENMRGSERVCPVCQILELNCLFEINDLIPNFSSIFFLSLSLPLPQLVCRVGVSDDPLSHSHSLSQSLETTLLECGFTDPTMAKSLCRLALDTALSCLCVVMETESSMSAEQRGGAGAQTDMIGVDLLFTMDGSIIRPVILGLHPSLCLHSSFQERGMGMEGCDSGIEEWSRGTLLLTPLTRSQYHLMQGKTVLVVGAGGHSKKFIWKTAKQYKLKVNILLVDSDPAHFASQLVDHFLPLPDLPDHRRDDQHCSRICDWLLSSSLHPDGCVCFWDECVVLTSLVCDRLGLRGPPPEAIRIAKEKSRTHRHLLGLLKSTGTNLISVEQPSGQPDSLVEFREDERRASGGEGGPAVMKLEYGAGAVGVRKVGSLEESLAHFERISGDLREETDYPGIGLGWGNAMILMEYVGGTEHDVDVVLFEGRLEGAFVSDNGPTRTPAFTETAAQMPSGLAPDKRAQLIRAAHHACLGCGLRDGVFNVELKMTEVGPRLIEINARMGGFYLCDWIRQLYGVDLLMAAFMVSCGVRPCLPSATALPARGHFAGVMVVVSRHLQALRTTASPERLRGLHQEGALWLNELAEEDELISGEYEEPFCNVGVRDAHNATNARQRLLALCQGLGLHCPPRYDLGYFLSHFN